MSEAPSIEMVCDAAKTPAKSLSSIRNPLLYPAELRAQLRSEVAASECHVQVFMGQRAMKSIMFAIGLAGIGLAVAFSLLRTENRKENDPMNSLMVIVPYKYEGLWVFDDAAVGLSKEPFIAGIDTLIDKATASIPDAQHGFRAIFSGTQFPGANFKLEWCRAESGGNWYYSPEFNQEGWLCPALFKYFKSAPAEIYVKVEPRNEG
jgi:hypothetical protein